MDSSNHIKFSCPSCGKKFRLESRYAGKKARCPQCKSIFTIPALDSQEQSSTAELPPQKGGASSDSGFAPVTATPRDASPGKKERLSESAKANYSQQLDDDELKKLEGPGRMRPEPVETPGNNEIKSSSATMSEEGERQTEEEKQDIMSLENPPFSGRQTVKEMKNVIKGLRAEGYYDAQISKEKKQALFSKGSDDLLKIQLKATQKAKKVKIIIIGSFVLLCLTLCIIPEIPSILGSLFSHENKHGTPRSLSENQALTGML